MLRNLFSIPNVQNLRDTTDVSPVFLETEYQKSLFRAGVNPEKYFILLRALVIDYGFETIVAVQLLNHISNMVQEEAQRYFGEFIFTVGRKLGNIVGLQPLSQKEITDLNFTTTPPDFQTVIKTVPKSRGFFVPYGPIMYKNFDKFGAPTYNEALDGNLLLEMTPLKTVFRNAIKMIISDRASGVPEPAKLFKKTKTRAQMVEDRLFREYIPDANSGMYDIPEWTPNMLSRRETRIRWIIVTELRNWRCNMISKKRASLWESGYVQMDYDPTKDPTVDANIPADSEPWSIDNMFNSRYLPNWVREKAVSLYDTLVLEPVYKSCLKKVNSFYHTRYPVTIEEIVYYMLDVLDAMWSRDYESNESKKIYMEHLHRLVSRYHLEQAWQYLKIWLQINGIMDVQSTTSQDFEAEIMASFSEARDPLFREKISTIYRFVKDIMNPTGRHKITFSDSDFVISIKEYLSLLMENITENAIVQSDIVTPLALTMIVQMCISNITNITEKNLNNWNQVKVLADGTMYPTLYDTFVKDTLTMALAVGAGNISANSIDWSAIKGELEKVKLTDIAKKPLDLNNIMFRIAPPLPIGAPQRSDAESLDLGYKIFQNIVIEALTPATVIGETHRNNLPQLIEDAGNRLYLFFSKDQINRSGALELYTPEEEEIVDTILNMESLSVSDNVKGSLTVSAMGDRVVTVNHNGTVVIEIKPTVEFTVMTTPQYTFNVYFWTRSAIERGEDKRLIQETTTSEIKQTIKVTLTENESGYLTCDVISKLQDGTVFAVGSMPQVIVERMIKCKRSAKEFKLGCEGSRVFARFQVDNGRPEVKLSTAVYRPVKWKDDTLSMAISEVDDSVLDASETLSTLYDLFVFCFTLEREGKMDHTKNWYNCEYMDVNGIKAAVSVEINPYKRHIEYKQQNNKTHLETTEHAMKTKIRVYKKLFMFEEFNNMLQEEIVAGDITKIAESENTVDGLTFRNELIEMIYARNMDKNTAFVHVCSKLPYYAVLNYMASVLNLKLGQMKQEHQLTYPKVYAEKIAGGDPISFAIECVTELMNKFVIMLQWMSLKKSIQTHDSNVTLGNIFQLGKFLTASLEKIHNNIDSIPKDTKTEDQEEMFETCTENDYLNLITPNRTIDRAVNTYNARVKTYNAKIQSGAELDIEYIGFHSERASCPFFFELFHRDMKPVTWIPTVPRQVNRPGALPKILSVERLAYKLVTKNFTLAYGDMSAMRVGEMERRQKTIERLFERLVKSINTTAKTANPDILNDLVKECQSYNSLLLR